jgi:cytoskeletal protein CcmA (bactofilin family)
MRLSRGNRGGLAFNELGIETAVVRCYHCGRAASISARALTARCEHCGKNLDIQDLRIKGHHWGGILVTCGRISIGRKAEVTCTMAVASLGIDIMGRFTGLLVSGGPVTVASRASVRGAVWAPSITLEPGASLVGGPCVVPCDPLGYVELNGNRTQVPSSPPPVRAA